MKFLIRTKTPSVHDSVVKSCLISPVIVKGDYIGQKISTVKLMYRPTLSRTHRVAYVSYSTRFRRKSSYNLLENARDLEQILLLKMPRRELVFLVSLYPRGIQEVYGEEMLLVMQGDCDAILKQKGKLAYFCRIVLSTFALLWDIARTRYSQVRRSKYFSVPR